MLSNLANYLLGNSSSSNSNEVAQPDPVSTTRLINETEEDDWVVLTVHREEAEAANMEESWFVTPPACFTSTGPVSVETSPLENLLIEHPSMSVYRSRPEDRPINPAPEPAPVDENQRPPAQEPQRRDVTAPPRHRNPLHHIVLQQQQHRRAQRQCIERTSELLKPKYLERGNKAREANGRNKRQRRSDRQRHHSGANNNRKC